MSEALDRAALIRVVAPHFVAGFLWDPIDNRVVEAAPILRLALMGKTADQARVVAEKRG